jgi:hypothetical protein
LGFECITMVRWLSSGLGPIRRATGPDSDQAGRPEAARSGGTQLAQQLQCYRTVEAGAAAQGRRAGTEVPGKGMQSNLKVCVRIVQGIQAKGALRCCRCLVRPRPLARSRCRSRPRPRWAERSRESEKAEGTNSSSGPKLSVSLILAFSGSSPYACDRL